MKRRIIFLSTFLLIILLAQNCRKDNSDKTNPYIQSSKLVGKWVIIASCSQAERDTPPCKPEGLNAWLISLRKSIPGFYAYYQHMDTGQLKIFDVIPRRRSDIYFHPYNLFIGPFDTQNAAKKCVQQLVDLHSEPSPFYFFEIYVIRDYGGALPPESKATDSTQTLEGKILVELHMLGNRESSFKLLLDSGGERYFSISSALFNQYSSVLQTGQRAAVTFREVSNSINNKVQSVTVEVLDIRAVNTQKE